MTEIEKEAFLRRLDYSPGEFQPRHE